MPLATCEVWAGDCKFAKRLHYHQHKCRFHRPRLYDVVVSFQTVKLMLLTLIHHRVQRLQALCGVSYCPWGVCLVKAERYYVFECISAIVLIFLCIFSVFSIPYYSNKRLPRINALFLIVEKGVYSREFYSKHSFCLCTSIFFIVQLLDSDHEEDSEIEIA